MQKHIKIFTIPAIFFIMLAVGCNSMRAKKVETAAVLPPSLTRVDQIDSFSPEAACRQALEVVNNNPYNPTLFEKIFARLVEQCKNSTSPHNADLIWDHFVEPLRLSGKVPPDLVRVTWNYYFSRQFVSLPDTAPVTTYCHDLEEIKASLEKEYELKKAGFEICLQGSPDPHFLNAMYVYNTLWAVCSGTRN